MGTTKREFIRAYLDETGVSDHFRRSFYVCLPCHCGHHWCEGWAHVLNTPGKIQHHWDNFVNQPEDDGVDGLDDDWGIFGLGDDIEGLFDDDDDEIAGLDDDEIAGLDDDEIAGLDDDEIAGLDDDLIDGL